MLLDAAAQDSLLQSALIVALLSFSAAALALITLGRLARHQRREELVPNSGLLTDGCVFIFSGRNLWLASNEAQEFLDQFGNGETDPWNSLVRYFRNDCPGIARMLNDLTQMGTAFICDVTLSDGTITQIEGLPRGSLGAVYLRDLTQDRIDRNRLSDDLKATRKNRDALISVLNHAPGLAWRRRADGRVLWANDRMWALLQSLAGPDELNRDSAELPRDFHCNSTPSRMSLRQAADDETVTWFEISEHPVTEDDFVGYALNIDGLVNTEITLNRFLATLTDTFAHLPIGLATFDSDRHLSLFNPSLSDLLNLDSTWLAEKPTLREFLDRMRDLHIMPEQRDFDSWRAQTKEIEDGALDGTLKKKWVMPTGQTFQITGRPHPNGALALLFEDITSRAVMEQNYRAEMEASQATLDRLSESVAVFDTAGALVFANAAFSGLWGFDPMASLGSMSVMDAVTRWTALTAKTDVWDDLRKFATGAGNRKEWAADITLTDGRRIVGRFAPMPNGSTLTVFEDMSSADDARRLHNNKLADIKRAHAREVALIRLAMDDMKTTLEDLRDGAPVEENAIAVTVRDTVVKALARSSMVVDQAEIAGAGASIFGDQIPVIDRLTDLVLRHGLKIEASPSVVEELDGLDGMQQRAVFNLMQVAVDLAEQGSGVDLSLVRLDHAVAMTSLIQTASRDGIETAEQDCMPFRLLSRYAAGVSGSASLEQLDDGKSIRISCTIPGVFADGVDSSAESDRKSA